MNRLWRVALAASLDTRWAALVLLLAGWALYHPALDRLFADDQIHYLAELNGDTSLLAGLRHWDYPITRQFWKGDDALFRPLIYVWMAVANHFFAYHHFGWNVATLSLHVLVALALFRLLLDIRPSPFALPAAVLFLVLKPPVELVVWNHLGGYLLAFLFFLIGTRALVRLLRAAPGSNRAVIGYAASFAAAAHLYEVMAVASVVGVAILVALDWQRHRRVQWKRTAILLCPFLLFVSLYVVHAARVQRFSYIDRPESSDQIAPRDVQRSVTLAGSVTGHWLAELALPVSVRLTTRPFVRFVKSIDRSWRDRSLQMNAALALGALAVLIGTLSLAQLKRQSALLAFVLATLGTYLVVLGTGRSASEIVGVTYYTYLFAVLMAVLLYTLVDFDRLFARAWLTGLAAAVLTAYIALHWSLTAGTARDVERENHYPARYFNQIVRFIDAHKQEPDFSFAIQPHPETLDPSIQLVEGYPDNSARSQRRLLSEILFARYYNSAEPKYVLDPSATRIVQ